MAQVKLESLGRAHVALLPSAEVAEEACFAAPQQNKKITLSRIDNRSIFFLARLFIFYLLEY